MVGLGILILAGSAVAGGASQPPVLTICELIEESAALQGTMVRVRGRIAAGFETFEIRSPACTADDRVLAAIWLEVPAGAEQPFAPNISTSEYVDAVRTGSLEQFAASLTWITPQPVRFHNDEEWEELGRLLQLRGAALATIIGRLDYDASHRLVRTSIEGYAPTKNYGHCNGYSRRIVIERVEDVQESDPLQEQY